MKLDVPQAIFLAIAVLLSSVAHGKEVRTSPPHRYGNIQQNRCDQLKNKLGQLFYANVDGFGDEAAQKQGAISPLYIKMVRDLNIGGVLPKPNSSNLLKMQASYEKLKDAVELPLLMGVDYHKVSHGGSVLTYFGMGTRNGFLGARGNDSPECLMARSYLDAFLHRSVGLNHTLGPTVEHTVKNEFLSRPSAEVAAKTEIVVGEFERMGIPATIKHYPYTPDTFDLHDISKDTAVSPDEVKRKLEIFGELAGSTNFVMSTHLLNSNIDPDNVATFSKKWIDILRNDLKFEGILMTDGLFMFDHYPASIAKMAAKWPAEEIPVKNNQVIFATRAILAGHDMVLLEGTSSQTYEVFNGLLEVACTDSPMGAELYRRVNESYERIVNWKNARAISLKQKPDIPEELIVRAGELYSSSWYGELSNTLCQTNEMAEFQALKLELEKLNILPLDYRP